MCVCVRPVGSNFIVCVCGWGVPFLTCDNYFFLKKIWGAPAPVSDGLV